MNENQKMEGRTCLKRRHYDNTCNRFFAGHALFSWGMTDEIEGRLNSNTCTNSFDHNPLKSTILTENWKRTYLSRWLLLLVLAQNWKQQLHCIANSVNQSYNNIPNNKCEATILRSFCNLFIYFTLLTFLYQPKVLYMFSVNDSIFCYLEEEQLRNHIYILHLDHSDVLIHIHFLNSHACSLHVQASWFKNTTRWQLEKKGETWKLFWETVKIETTHRAVARPNLIKILV